MVLQPRCMLVGTGSAVARRAWGRLGKAGDWVTRSAFGSQGLLPRAAQGQRRRVRSVGT